MRACVSRAVAEWRAFRSARRNGLADLGGDRARWSDLELGPRSLAFIAALQHPPANQRAVMILREVLGFSAREVAESLGSTVASVHSALQRARRTVDERVPAPSQQATLRALGDQGLRQMVADYMDAMERGDVEGWSPCWPTTPPGRCPLLPATGPTVRRSGTGATTRSRRSLSAGRC
jgi:hypothetical protein